MEKLTGQSKKASREKGSIGVGLLGSTLYPPRTKTRSRKKLKRVKVPSNSMFIVLFKGSLNRSCGTLEKESKNLFGE